MSYNSFLNKTNIGRQMYAAAQGFGEGSTKINWRSMTAESLERPNNNNNNNTILTTRAHRIGEHNITKMKSSTVLYTRAQLYQIRDQMLRDGRMSNAPVPHIPIPSIQLRSSFFHPHASAVSHSAHSSSMHFTHPIHGTTSTNLTHQAQHSSSSHWPHSTHQTHLSIHPAATMHCLPTKHDYDSSCDNFARSFSTTRGNYRYGFHQKQANQGNSKRGLSYKRSGYWNV